MVVTDYDRDSLKSMRGLHWSYLSKEKVYILSMYSIIMSNIRFILFQIIHEKKSILSESIVFLYVIFFLF